MKKAYLISLFAFLIFFAVSAQKSTILLKDSFKHITLSGDQIEVNIIEDNSYAIVSEGIPVDGIYFNLKNGLLDIYLKKGTISGKESLSILFPTGKPVPKVISLSEWVSLDLEE